MDYRSVGRIHPAFFKHSPLFNRFDKVFDEKGGVRLRSPFFVLEYSLVEGSLGCDDSDVLYDFVNLLSENYGSRVTRQDIYDSIDWGSVSGNWSVMSVGVCILDNDDSGWDGSPNAIWYDNNFPGEIIRVFAQFWSRQLIFDAWKLTESEVLSLGDAAVPNLIDSLLTHKNDKVKHRKIEKLIGLF